MLRKILFKNTPALALSIILFFAFGSFLMYAAPVHAASSQGNPIMDFNNGWQYRIGNSPVNGNGVPVWTLEQPDGSGWNDYRFADRVLMRNASHTSIWARVKLPEKSWESASMYFDMVLCESFEVYLDGQCIYKYKQSSPAPTISQYILNRFLVPLRPDYQGKVLYVRIYSDLNSVGLYRDVSIGSHRELMQMMLKKDLDNIIVGFFFIVFGLFMLPTIIFLNLQYKKTLLALSFFIIDLGLWFIFQSINVKIIFFDESGIWNVLNNLTVYIIPIFLLLFFEQIFGSGYKSIMRILWKFHIVLVAVYFCILNLNLLFKMPVGNIVHYFNTVYFALVFIDFLIMVLMIIQSALKGDFEAKIFAAGFIVFSLLSLYELGVYMLTHKIPFMYKWGILIFIASLILIMGRRFSDAHNRIVDYSNELESKNVTLNHMWKEVKQSRDEIEQLNKTLEYRVIERTRQLEHANKEQKKTLETLMKTHAQLVQSEKLAALGGLVAGVAHEINTPVGVGVTAASHLEKKSMEFAALYKDNKLKRSDFENFVCICSESTTMILSNLKRASELIKSFKMVAVDQSSEERRKFRVKEYINEVLLSLSPKLKKVKHCIDLDCPDDLEIDNYPGAFSQVITNLLMNSIMHAYDDGDEGYIKFDISRNDNTVIFKYSDNGKGIDKKILDKIFDPFFTTKRNKGGTGLGLNILYNIVTQTFGGTIVCESTPGTGTTFIIEFSASKAP